MRFSDSFLNEIKNRLPITKVVGEYVSWSQKKSQPAKGDMWACCPFHNEKTPSFHADDRRGRYYCFSCHASGDHFRFLVERAGLNFPQAVEKLANLAGVPMPAYDEKSQQREKERNSYYEIMELSTKYFINALNDNIGAQARGYLLKRHISPDLQTKFRIGFAPNSRNGLKEYLARNGVSADEMLALGLIVGGENIAIPYDRFRNRVIFPIMDFRSKVIGFGGRSLAKEVTAKYINSPETELFHKRKTLYNIQNARQAAFDGKELIVVEGYTDVISMSGAGFTATVAPLGTALSEEHLTLLWSMKKIPILCFDGDIAGRKAANRAIEMALQKLQPGYSIKIITLPEGEDPDNIIIKGGREAFLNLIENAKPLSDMVWEIETGGIVPQTPEKRAELEDNLKKKANIIKHPSVRRHYLQLFAEKLHKLFTPHFYTKNSTGKKNFTKTGKFNVTNLTPSEELKNSPLLKSSVAQDISAREAAILMCLINHPSLIEERLEDLAQLEFENNLARQILSDILDIIANFPDVEAKEMEKKLVKKGYEDSLKKMQNLLNRQGIWQIRAEIAKNDAEIGLKHALALHYKSVQLNKELRAAEIALGEELSEENLEKLRDIQNQISTVDGTEALIEGFGSLSGRIMGNI